MTNKQRIQYKLQTEFTKLFSILHLSASSYNSFKEVVDRNNGLKYFYKDTSATVKKAEAVVKDVNTSINTLMNYCNLSSQPFEPLEEINLEQLLFSREKDNKELAIGIIKAKLGLLIHERYNTSMQKSID